MMRGRPINVMLDFLVHFNAIKVTFSDLTTLREHLEKECKNVTVKCKTCEVSISRGEIQNHESCKEELVKLVANLRQKINGL